jgi:hypothetical protein
MALSKFSGKTTRGTTDSTSKFLWNNPADNSGNGEIDPKS